MGQVPIAIFTGEFDPDHTREIDEETDSYFLPKGLNSRLCYLPDHGIRGSGHMMMLEKNNSDVLDMICSVIA